MAYRVFVRSFLAVVLFVTGIGLPDAFAFEPSLPAPAPAYTPVLLKGIRIDTSDPFHLEFIVDTADAVMTPDELRSESSRLIRYFLACLTIPEKDLWVNLSPYESDRIIPRELAATEFGEGMLAADYVLKQLSSSLTHPDTGTGREYWTSRRGDPQGRPEQDLSKIWIVPSDAEIYVDNNKAFVTKVTLKVRDEGAYWALIPEIEREVNEGERFAPLRQMANALMLATWFKLYLKESALVRAYADQKKVKGVDLADPDAKEKVYQQYLEVFRKGAYDVMRKEREAHTGRLLKRRYVAGGCTFDGSSAIVRRKLSPVSGNETKISSSMQNILKVDAQMREAGSSAVSARYDDGSAAVAARVDALMSQEGIFGRYPDHAREITVVETIRDENRLPVWAREGDPEAEPYFKNQKAARPMIVALFEDIDELSTRELRRRLWAIHDVELDGIDGNSRYDPPVSNPRSPIARMRSPDFYLTDGFLEDFSAILREIKSYAVRPDADMRGLVERVADMYQSAMIEHGGAQARVFPGINNSFFMNLANAIMRYYRSDFEGMPHGRFDDIWIRVRGKEQMRKEFFTHVARYYPHVSDSVSSTLKAPDMKGGVDFDTTAVQMHIRGNSSAAVSSTLSTGTGELAGLTFTILSLDPLDDASVLFQ